MARIGGSRSTRLRTAGIVVLLAGLAVGYLLGTTLGAAVTLEGTRRFVDYTRSPSDGIDTTFNWLVFLLTFGPLAVAGATLLAAAEVVQTLGRRSRSRSSRGADLDELDLT